MKKNIIAFHLFSVCFHFVFWVAPLEASFAPPPLLGSTTHPDTEGVRGLKIGLVGWHRDTKLTLPWGRKVSTMGRNHATRRPSWGKGSCPPRCIFLQFFFVMESNFCNKYFSVQRGGALRGSVVFEATSECMCPVHFFFNWELPSQQSLKSAVTSFTAFGWWYSSPSSSPPAPFLSRTVTRTLSSYSSPPLPRPVQCCRCLGDWGLTPVLAIFSWFSQKWSVARCSKKNAATCTNSMLILEISTGYFAFFFVIKNPLYPMGFPCEESSHSSSHFGLNLLYCSSQACAFRETDINLYQNNISSPPVVVHLLWLRTTAAPKLQSLQYVARRMQGFAHPLVRQRVQPRIRYYVKNCVKTKSCGQAGAPPKPWLRYCSDLVWVCV